MPTWRGLLERWPHARLGASEGDVGLPPGQMGNSEVGHLNLGAGRPVLQDLPRIDAAIADGSFFERPAFLDRLRTRPSSAAGPSTSSAWSGRAGSTPTTGTSWPSPSWRTARRVPAVRLHALLDGRDTPPASALGFVADLEARLAAAHPGAAIASVGGRYFAMDRDQRWDRTERGYDAIVHGEAAFHAPSATEAIEAAYARGETDEFVAPTVIDRVREAASATATRSSTRTSVPTGPDSSRTRSPTARHSPGSTARRRPAARPRRTCSS